MTALGTVVAILVPETAYANFLYWISAVFVPLAVVQITCVLLHVTGNAHYDWRNSLVWVLGVGLYQLFLARVTPVGSTLPTVVAVAGLTVLVNWRRREHARK